MFSWIVFVIRHFLFLNAAFSTQFFSHILPDLDLQLLLVHSIWFLFLGMVLVVPLQQKEKAVSKLVNVECSTVFSFIELQVRRLLDKIRLWLLVIQRRCEINFNIGFNNADTTNLVIRFDFLHFLFTNGFISVKFYQNIKHEISVGDFDANGFSSGETSVAS